MRITAVAAASLFAAACTTPTGTDQRPSLEHPATVEVTVYGNLGGAPLAGEKVAFVDPDGTGTIVVTGADGVARGQVAIGGSVTALIDKLVPDNPPYLSTILDVQDGDHLAIGMPPFTPPAKATGTPTCADDALTARYTGVDPARVSAIYLQRSDDNGGVTDGMATAVTATTDVAIAGPGAPRAFLETSLAGPNQGDQQFIRDTIDGCATAYQLDLGNNLLPWVGVPSLDIDHGVIHTPIDGVGGGDLFDVMFSLQRGADYINWNVVAPHTGDVVLPELPPELATYLPQAGDQLHSSAAWLIDADGVHGYDDARTRAAELMNIADNQQGLTLDRIRVSYRIALF